MKTITNASMFIVPNGLVSKANTIGSHFLSNEEWFKKDLCMQGTAKDLADRWHILLSPKDRLVQVWIHCEEQDNLSDHGFDEEQYEELFPKSGKALEESVDIWRYPRLAPDRLPIRLFEGKKEGDTITLTSCDGVDWEIKLEQLPFRYGHRGPFERCLRALMCSDEEYARMKGLELSRLQDAGLKGSYDDPEVIIGRLAVEFPIRVEKRSYGTFIYNTKKDVPLATVENGKVIPNLTCMLRDQHTLERFVYAVSTPVIF